MSREHRLSELLRLRVQDPDGHELGALVDVRATRDTASGRLRVTGLLVAPRHTGSLLGYERDAVHGPALVRWAVRRLHRGAFHAPWEAVRSIDWDEGRVVIDR